MRSVLLMWSSADLPRHQTIETHKTTTSPVNATEATLRSLRERLLGPSCHSVLLVVPSIRVLV